MNKHIIPILVILLFIITTVSPMVIGFKSDAVDKSEQKTPDEKYACGCPNTQYPIAEFTWTPTVPEPYIPINFDASGSYDLDGYITLYEWDWDNDGEFDENHTGPTTTHFWEVVGDFPVTLRVTDNASLTGMKTKYVRVRKGPFDTPAIIGQTCGKVGIEYEYIFVQTNPHGDAICYFIDWGNNTTTGWTDFYEAGERIRRNHTWYDEGDYIIKAKVKDFYGRESSWATLEVTMPKSKPFNFNFPQISWSLVRFPILNHIVNLLMEKWI